MDCTLRSVQGQIYMKPTLDKWRSAGEPRAPKFGLFVKIFLTLLCFFHTLTLTIKKQTNWRRWDRENEVRKWFCMSGGIENTADCRIFFFLTLITAAVWEKKYKKKTNTACYVRCHHVLSFVMIQRSPALKITALVCWSASWLIVNRPPNSQHEACHIIVFFYYCACSKWKLCTRCTQWHLHAVSFQLQWWMACVQ